MVRFTLMFVYFQVDPTDSFIKESFGDNVEFPDENGSFDLSSYPDRTEFEVLGNEFNNFNFLIPPAPVPPQSSSSPAPILTQSSSGRRFSSPLATIKIVRVDLGSNGKPTNIHAYNLTAHVNFYQEKDACVDYIQERARIEMDDQTINIVGSNGLIVLDQEATRGNIHLLYILFAVTFV